MNMKDKITNSRAENETRQVKQDSKDKREKKPSKQKDRANDRQNAKTT